MTELEEYYTASQAAEVLSKNSGKKISPAYVRKLALYGKLEPKQVGTRLNLYPKSQVDSYVVENRADKANRVKKEKAHNRTHQEPASKEATGETD